MARYPYITERNVSKGFEEILSYVNDVTNSWISNMLLVGIFIIAFLGIFATRKDIGEAFAGSGFLLVMTATFFWVFDFISITPLITCIVVAIFGFAVLWFSRG